MQKTVLFLACSSLFLAPALVAQGQTEASDPLRLKKTMSQIHWQPPSIFVDFFSHSLLDFFAATNAIPMLLSRYKTTRWLAGAISFFSKIQGQDHQSLFVGY